MKNNKMDTIQNIYSSFMITDKLL